MNTSVQGAVMYESSNAVSMLQRIHTSAPTVILPSSASGPRLLSPLRGLAFIPPIINDTRIQQRYAFIVR